MKLRVLTLNCWGVPIFSRDRILRMRAIGQALAQFNFDVVALQEVYREEDRQIIAQHAVRGGLVYTHYFPSGLIGSGLFTLSRFPIEATGFLRFRLNGRSHDLARSDYYAGKGVGRLRLRLPIGAIDVYNAHFIAPYLEFGPDIYFAHRVAQALETVRYIQVESKDVPTVLMSDINSIPDSLVYRTLVSIGELEDTYRSANPSNPGITVSEEIPYIGRHAPERIDFVFARSGRERSIITLSSALAMTEIPETNTDRILAYSDHFGVSTALEIENVPTTEASGVPVDAGLVDSISEALEHGIQCARDAQLKAGAWAGIAGLTATVVLCLRGKQAISRRDFLRVMVAVAAAGLLVVIGLFSVSAAIQLNYEIEAMRMILRELRQEL